MKTVIYNFDCNDFLSKEIFHKIQNIKIFFLKLFLSVNVKKKSFDKLDLYTDTFGALMLEPLELPFNTIQTKLYVQEEKYPCVNCNQLITSGEKNNFYYNYTLNEIKREFPEFLPKMKSAIRRLEERGFGSEFLYTFLYEIDL